MTYTPGPWRVIEKVGFSVYPEDSPVYIAFMNNARSNCEANANLMAAAPEMLEALERIRGILKDNPNVRVQAKDIGNDLAVALNFERVDKAIAKAKGE